MKNHREHATTHVHAHVHGAKTAHVVRFLCKTTIITNGVSSALQLCVQYWGEVIFKKYS